MKSRRRHSVGTARHGAKKSGGRRRLVPVLLILLVLALGYFLFSLHQVRGGMRAFLVGEDELAGSRFDRAMKLKLLVGGGEEGLALLALERRDYEQAAAGLARAEAALLRFSGLGGRAELLFQRYLDRGDYEALALIGEYLESGGRSGDELDYHLGCAYLGLNRLGEAADRLGKLDRSGVSPLLEQARRPMALIEERSRKRRFENILDRDRVPLAAFDLETEKLKALEDGFSGLLGQGEAGEGGLEGALDRWARANVTLLSIDGDFQRAAYQALGKHQGALVVVDPASGDLLAVASKGRHGGSMEAIPAFGSSYEPASVIKLITLAAAIRSGQFQQVEMFPFQCAGNTNIDGKIFYDWITHGTVAHVDQAMAVSCNLVFAQLGLLVGKARLEEELAHFLFGATLEDTLLPMPLGRVTGDPTSPWEVANLAVGLDSLEVTPLHLALIAAAVGNGGELMKPRLLLGRENILGRPMASSEPQLLGQVIDEETARILTDTMFEVVENERGTGRRAKVEGLDLAVKTGTGGDRRQGLDAVMIGFSPAHEPRIAFAVVLSGGGKAELAAARVAKSFLDAISHELTAPARDSSQS